MLKTDKVKCNRAKDCSELTCKHRKWHIPIDDSPEICTKWEECAIDDPETGWDISIKVRCTKTGN